MRTRQKKARDYGITAEEEKKIYSYCRDLKNEERLELFRTAIAETPGLEIPIYDSLISGLGYRTIDRMRPIYAKEEDFYAYKRKTAIKFYQNLQNQKKK